MAKGKFKSERQRRFLWAKVPHVAKAWAHGKSAGKKGGGKAKGGKKK